MMSDYHTNGATGQPALSALPLLSLQGLTITYEDGQRRALRDIDFSIHEGETVLLAGPSGCGKSTLVSFCAGLIPDAIEAKVTGDVVLHPKMEVAGAIGMVFQDPETQFCMLEARDELAFGLENRCISRDEMPARMWRAMQQIRFAPHPETSLRQLSGGQKQKLAIAAALVMAPTLLILDEPTSNLDPAATATVMQQIKALRAAGQTMLIVEHKFQALLDVVDRVVLLSEDGTVAASGSPKEVMAGRGSWLVQHGVVAPWAAMTGDVDGQVDTGGGSEADTSAGMMDDGGEPPAVEVKAGTAAYGDKRVLHGIDVRIPRGSFTAIVGPNGVGKSTLLQAMAGLTDLSSGQIRVFGAPLGRKQTAARSQISYCFQNPELQFIYERVADELANERIRGSVPAAIVDALAAFGLAGTANQSPFSLSQGQKRRLSVAVMLHADRQLYLLDEPTYGQDVKTQAAILEVLCSHQQQGKTIAITTHDMDLVRRYATHVVVLGAGRVLYQGSPAELWARPDILRQAHLDGSPEEDMVIAQKNDGHEVAGKWLALPERKVRKPADWFNPVWLVLTMVCAGLIGTYAGNLVQAAVFLGLSIVWLLSLAWMSPWRIIKWFSPFVLIYLFYLWSFAAFTAVPPGTPSFHFLWANFSWYGLRTGLLVAVRMLSSVGYLILLLVSLDATGLIVGFCQNLRIPPKFAYGVLAGMRLAPLFQSEWGQLTRARELRGRKPRFACLQPIAYSLPLLSLAVRSSERLAIAMEARGLVHDVANHAKARTYLRIVPVRARDWVLLVAVNAIVMAIMVFVHP